MMDRVEIVAYVAEGGDCTDDVDRAVQHLRELLSPELVIVHKTKVDEAAVAAAMQEEDPELWSNGSSG